MRKTIAISLIICLILLIYLRFFNYDNHKIIHYVDENCKFNNCDSCIVNLNNLFGGKIDFIFVFYPGTSQIEISKAIGVNYENDREIYDERRRIIITQKNKILLDEDYLNNKIDFEGGEFVEILNHKRLSNPYDKFKKSTFKVRKFKVDDFYFFSELQK